MLTQLYLRAGAVPDPQPALVSHIFVFFHYLFVSSHQKENATLMNAAEFRCLALSLRRYRSAEPSLDVLLGEFREVAKKESLVDPRFHSWVIQAGLDLL